MAEGPRRIGSYVAWWIATAAFVASACTAPIEDAAPPTPSRCAFERDVYPVLARDCGFPACHGDADRFFQVWAPGRTRLSSATLQDAPLEPTEVDRTYERARSMLAGAATPDDALLLRKPLSVSAGGAAHLGTDALGRDVYLTEEAAGWQAIATWAREEGTPCE